MNQKQFIILLVAVIVSSFLGGMSVALLTVTSAVSAKEAVNHSNEIRSRAVHLIDQDNKIRASFYLGANDAPQLVLYDKKGTSRFNVGLAPAGNPGMAFNDNGFNKLIDIGTSDNRARISIADRHKRTIWQAP